MLLLLAGAGIVALALFVSPNSALILGAFMLINALFYHVLRRPNEIGEKLLDQALAYREFLAAVDSDVLTRTRSAEQVPANLNQRDAYAIAFHLDLGWGERFVTAIAGYCAGNSQDSGESGGRQAYQGYRNL
jgi:hypothetical protein